MGTPYEAIVSRCSRQEILSDDRSTAERNDLARIKPQWFCIESASWLVKQRQTPGIDPEKPIFSHARELLQKSAVPRCAIAQCAQLDFTNLFMRSFDSGIIVRSTESSRRRVDTDQAQVIACRRSEFRRFTRRVRCDLKSRRRCNLSGAASYLCSDATGLKS